MAKVSGEQLTRDPDALLSFGMEVDPPKVHFDLAKALQRWARVIGPMIREEIRRQAPVNTAYGAQHPGRLKDSTFWSKFTTATGIEMLYTSRWGYAKYVIEGTQPHEIDHKTMRVLHWLDTSGADHFAEMVHHPGAKPDPYPQRAWDRVSSEVRRLLHEELKRL